MYPHQRHGRRAINLKGKIYMSNAKELFELTEKAVTAQQILLKYIENKDHFRETVDTALDGIEDEKSKACTLTSLISYTLTKESEIETDEDALFEIDDD